MVKMSVLSDALKNIVNAEKAGKRQVMIRPVSKVVVKFLRVMQKHGYINAFEIIDDARNGKIVVDLNGRLNKWCHLPKVRPQAQELREVRLPDPSFQTVRIRRAHH